MMKFAILFALVAAAAADPIPRLNPLSRVSRIVGGQNAAIEEVPYMVSIEVFNIPICGGTIIGNFWILTAAQCMLYFPSWYTIRSGTTFRGAGGVSTPLAFVLAHDNYGVDGLGIPVNDIALLRLRAPLTWSPTQAPIGLYASGQEAVVGSAGVISGWGAVSEAGSATNVLQTANVPIVSTADCSLAYANFGGLREGQICAGVSEGRANCNGDTGGPLTINGLLAGVVSWSNGCARPGYPGVYTEISAYREWINIMSGI